MDLKRYIPHLTAIVIFTIVTAFFFSPIVFEGKRLKQSDAITAQGASKEIKDFREKTGTEPLWTNSMFGGMPAYQISVLYPMNFVQYIQKFFLKVFPAPVAMVLMCMIGFYLLLITMKVDPWLSIGGGIAFGLSSFFIIIIAAGHNTEAFAIAYMAPVLMGMLITLRGRLWLGGAVTALALALELYANHLQMTYYLLFIIGIVGVGEAIRLYREGKSSYLLKAVGILSAAVIIGILPNITNLVLTEQYGKYSTRGQSDITLDNKDQKKTSGLPIEYATQWSYGQAESFTLLIPNFEGGASESISEYDQDALKGVYDNDEQMKKSIGEQGAYFGDQPFTSGPVYVGAIICFLFILGLFIVKDSIKWWLLGATVLAIMLSWGKNFEGLTDFFFNHFPGYNKFRSVYWILVIAEIAMPLLAMLAVKEIVKNPGVVKEHMRKFYLAFGLTGGIALLIYIMPTTFVTPVGDTESKQITDAVKKQGGSADFAGEVEMNLETARLNIVQSDALRSFFFILLAGGLLFFYVRKPFGVLPLAGGLTLLILIDMWGVSMRYMSDKKGNYEKKPIGEEKVLASAADEKILQDPDPDYRVLNLAVSPWQDASTSYFHKSIGGYHGAKLKRIQELYENVMEKETQQLQQAMQMQLPDSGLREVEKNLCTLDMLNTKYVIYNPDAGGVLQNRYACGNAWFVGDIKMVDNADEELKGVEKFSPSFTAVIDKSFQPVLGDLKPKWDQSNTIKLVSYAPNDLKYTSNASSDQLAVFSEIYYDKGWNAYVDGNLTPHVRADFVLRAMKVPSGKHDIEFKFEPSFYYTGEKIALVGSLLLILFIAGGIYYDRKNQQGHESQEAA